MCGILIRLFVVIAVQNMESSHTVPKDQEVEFQALSGCLSMMSKGMLTISKFDME